MPPISESQNLLLRKANRISTIHSSLAIEGNTLSVEQVTTLLDDKRVIGPKEDILEVLNAIEVYNHLSRFDPFSQKSILEAHSLLMADLIDEAGTYRTQNVGIYKGNQVAHMAPPAWNVQNLMTHLFTYLNRSEDHLIIKSCVFHYELEFITSFYGWQWQDGPALANAYPDARKCDI